MLWWLSSARSRRRVWLRLSARYLKSKTSSLKTQKHLYCLVFTSRGYKKDMARENPDFIGVFFVSGIRFRDPKMFFDKRKRLPTLLCAGSRSWIFRYLS